MNKGVGGTAMIEAVTTPVTAEEFFEMSFQDQKAELIRGEVIRTSPTGEEHGDVAMNIGGFLWTHVRAHQLGKVPAAETGFLVARDPDTVRAPDTAFVSKERLGNRKRSKGYYPFPPDLAVEVVSPNDTAEQIEEKVREWFAGGSRMVWVFYPTPRTVHVYRSPTDVSILEEGDALSGEEVVPGFSCSVAEVFE